MVKPGPHPDQVEASLATIAELLLFLLPLVAYVIWRRTRAVAVSPSRLVWLVLAGLGLGLTGAVWYGLARSSDRGAAYVPARMTPDGRIEPGRLAPKPAP